MDLILAEELNGLPEDPVVIVREPEVPSVVTQGELSREELNRVFGIENDGKDYDPYYDEDGGQGNDDQGNDDQENDDVDDNNIAGGSANP